MNKIEYSNIVCNFLNNTQGSIEDYQIRFMLLELFDLDLEESELDKELTIDDKIILSKDIEWDSQEDFYNDMKKLYNRIINKRGDKNDLYNS